MNKAIAVVSSISLSRGSIQILRNANFSVGTGEIVGLAGPSGCGKTSILLALFGLLPINSGNIIFELPFGEYFLPGRHTRKRELTFRRSAQLLFQNARASLSPIRTLRHELFRVSSLHFPEISPKERLRRIVKVINEVGLAEHLLESNRAQLSGGECQKAALARALLVNPVLLACDEVWSSLDTSSTLAIVELLFRLRKEGMSLIIVSHQSDVLRRLCDRVLFISSEEENIVDRKDTQQ